MKKLEIILLIFLGFLLASCQKDTENWVWCEDCVKEEILGSYQGLAEYVRIIDSLHTTRKEDQSISLVFFEIETGLRSEASVPGIFQSVNFYEYSSGPYLNSNSFGKSLTATVYRSNEKLKIVGVFKSIDTEGNTTEYVDFEVYKSN